MFSLPLQEPEGDRDEANKKDRSGYESDHVRRYGVHGRDGRRETFRICFGLGLTSDYRLITKKGPDKRRSSGPKIGLRFVFATKRAFVQTGPQ